MRGPEAFVEHLQAHNYHPRSDAHSNALCLAILQDLVEHCAPIREKAARGELVAKLNHTVVVNYQEWNIDLALGPPPGSPVPPAADQPILFAVPTVVEIAIEAKGVMTEHGKARQNRLRDLQAFHGHAHQYDQKVIAVGVVVVNVADIFFSPTRTGDITTHHGIGRIGQETVGKFRNLPLRNTPADGAGLEAACVLVVRHDNLGHDHLSRHTPPAGGWPAALPTSLVEKAPAPQVGEPLHYATMIHRICSAYRERWA